MKKRKMKTFVEKRDDVVVLRFEGLLGFDDVAFETMHVVDEAVKTALAAGSTRFVVDLTKARAAWPSSIGLLFQPFLNVLKQNNTAKIALVASKVEPGRGFFKKTVRLTTDDLEMWGLTKVFSVFPDAEKAAHRGK